MTDDVKDKKTVAELLKEDSCYCLRLEKEIFLENCRLIMDCRYSKKCVTKSINDHDNNRRIYNSIKH